MKRLLATAISVVILLSCTACTEDVQSTPSDTTTTASAADATTTTTGTAQTTTVQPQNTTVTAAPAQTVIVYQPIVIDTTKKPATTQKKPAAHTHSYSKKVTPATCTKKGYTTYTCSCGDSYVADYVNPSHSYSQYVCTKCKAVDKSHAYEYLMAWVKKNGTAGGAYIHVEDRWEDGERATISYSANYDEVSISVSYYSDEDFCYNSISLKDGLYGVFLGSYEVIGYLDFSDYTVSSAIPYSDYEGPDDIKWDMIEYARIEIRELVKWFDWYLESIDIGITIADLGFTSY